MDKRNTWKQEPVGHKDFTFLMRSYCSRKTIPKQLALVPGTPQNGDKSRRPSDSGNVHSVSWVEQDQLAISQDTVEYILGWNCLEKNCSRRSQDTLPFLPL